MSDACPSPAAPATGQPTVLGPEDALRCHAAGGKARGLAGLQAAGFDVPPWFVVLPSGPVSDSEALSAASTESVSLDDALQPHLNRFAPGTRFAVRSSAVAEDGVDASFAGQFESFLNVPREDVPARIGDVRASANSQRVVAYRKGRGLDSTPLPPPAVVVQEMIDPIAAGVAFGADPASGRRDLCVLSAVPGLADKLVSGEVPADTWHVDRQGNIVRHTPRQHGAPPVLTPAHIQSLAILVRRANGAFGPAQDIEWAMDHRGFWILQARPITTLNAVPDPDAAPGLWDNSNIAESYSGMVSPLTFSFAREVYEEVYRQFCTLAAVRSLRIEAAAGVFANLLGYLRGRIYYNLPNWYRILALLPGYNANRAFMEQMMGVGETLPPALAPVLEENRQRRTPFGRIVGAMESARSGSVLLFRLFHLPSAERRFYRRLNAALSPERPPIDSLRLDQLVGEYRSLERALVRRWDAPIINDFFAMIFFGLLRHACTKWCGDPGGRLATAMVSGTGEVISAEPARRIVAMADRAARTPGAAEVLLHGTPADCERLLARDGVLAAEVKAYLAEFGERTVGELKLETETLSDDPLALYRAIGRTAETPPAPSRAAAHAPGFEAAEREAVAALRSGVLRNVRALLLRWIARNARARLRSRENLRFQRTRVFGRVRRLFVEMGRRLTFEGRLNGARDIFFLTTQEVLGFVEGTAASWDLRGLVAVRQAEHAHWKTQPPPAGRVETHGAPPLGNRLAPLPNATVPAAGSPAETFQGLGCSPGVARGCVRVISDPDSATLEPGEILVATRTDPGWILLFPAAAGLLVEFGSLLSHSAIVSRELGLPAVVAIPGLTAQLHTGDHVELDGTTGTVRVLQRASPGRNPS